MRFLAFWVWLEGRASGPTNGTPTRVATAADAVEIYDDGAWWLASLAKHIDSKERLGVIGGL